MRFIIFISSFLILTSMMSARADERAIAGPYYGLIYDFEVAQFCGLVNQHVHDVFWVKRNSTEEKSERSTEELRQTRIKAMAAADIEYANRGLGGYKPWCQSEGQKGVARIIGP